MITLSRFRRIEAAVVRAGHGEDVQWAEQIGQPADAREFAGIAINVVCNSGMKFSIAREIFGRCMAALEQSGSVRGVFGHPGKAQAIEVIWSERQCLFDQFHAAEDKLAFCEALPWVGPITKYHLAKDLGLDVAKPDVHLARLARRDRISVQRMCSRLARQANLRVATVDTILWRACATGILDSDRYDGEGWLAAFRGHPIVNH
ncbi:hypothetical protein GCM10023264_10800 [Sphingomonas daechungensis]|uniref:DNA lyase n=1 Tax=Sphingomonas daechungensis TaxID=1176646 RepID=A0ABX6T477_9SPHN|nr:hypothetical protein [Sphingomonas daechungensis]QNP44599.1 hypothetical protein H9L15_16085 [Sphingomonas daechungensis]